MKQDRTSATEKRGDGTAAGPAPLKSRPSIMRHGTFTEQGSSDSVSGNTQDAPLRARPSQLRRLQPQDSSDSTSSMTSIGGATPFEKSYKPAELKAMLAKQRQELASMGISGSSTRTSELQKTAKEYESGRRFTKEQQESEGSDEASQVSEEEGNQEPLELNELDNVLTPERMREKWRWAFEGVKRSMGFKAATQDGEFQAIRLMEATKKSIIESPIEKNLNNLTSQLSSMANPVRADNQKSMSLVPIIECKTNRQ